MTTSSLSAIDPVLPPRIELALQDVQRRLRLTPCQLRLVRMAVVGLSRSEIIVALAIAPSTYDFHARRIFDITGRRVMRLAFAVLYEAAAA